MSRQADTQPRWLKARRAWADSAIDARADAARTAIATGTIRTAATQGDWAAVENASFIVYDLTLFVGMTMDRGALMNDPIRDGAFVDDTLPDDFLHGRSASNRRTSRSSLSGWLATGDPRTLSTPSGGNTFGRDGCRPIRFGGGRLLSERPSGRGEEGERQGGSHSVHG